MDRADLLNKLAEFKRNNGEKYGILSIGILVPLQGIRLQI